MEELSKNKNFIFMNEETGIYIDNIDESGENWKVVQSELYKPDRDEYVYSCFKKDYPHLILKILDASMVYKLSSRSKNLSEWLAVTTSKYALDVAPPKWLQDEIDPVTYAETTKVLSTINKLTAEKANKEKELSEKYKLDLIKLNEVYEKQINNYKHSNLIKILSINSQSLPLTLQLMIESYTPAKADDSPSSKTYAREVLTRFKISLIRWNKTHPNLDISTLIDKLMGE